MTQMGGGMMWFWRRLGQGWQTNPWGRASVLDGSGNTTTTTYDRLGRVVSITLQVGRWYADATAV
jgi:YD repeat-containing protein